MWQKERWWCNHRMFIFFISLCERAHNYWGPCCQHLFSLWSPSSWIRKMKSGKFLVIAWKNFETFCTKAALNTLAREKTKMTTTPFENNNSIKSQQLFITEVFLCGSSSETSIVLCKCCTWTIGIISPPSSKIIIKYHGARNDTRASLHIAILISSTPSSPQSTSFQPSVCNNKVTFYAQPQKYISLFPNQIGTKKVSVGATNYIFV